MSKLLHSEQQLLADWAKQLNELFNRGHFGPYQVGSSLTEDTHRDIDLRFMFPTKDFNKLQKLMNIDYLNLVISLWGQKLTGLPIDFQIQDLEYANATHKGPRSAVWIRGISAGDGFEPTNSKVEEQK